MSSLLLYSPEDIEGAVSSLASKINYEYNVPEGHVNTVGVLVLMDGAFMFAADLLRKLNFPILFRSVKASSYGASTTSFGIVHIDKFPSFPQSVSKIIIIDDIFDTGRTIQQVSDSLRKFLTDIYGEYDLSIKSCCLFRKLECSPNYPDFHAFDVPADHFIYGYGLDNEYLHRDLAGVYRKL